MRRSLRGFRSIRTFTRSTWIYRSGCTAILPVTLHNSVCNPDLPWDVDSLLVADSHPFARHRLTVEAAAQQILGADPVIGARFDPWRVGFETGRGGMGIVYLVVRDDAQFQKHAASSSSEPVWTRRNCSPEGR